MVKNLFVGQRVRITASNNALSIHHIGKEGRIVSECDVHIGCFDVDVARTGIDGLPTSWIPEHLEPILPEGAQPSEFSFTELMDNLGVVVA